MVPGSVVQLMLDSLSTHYKRHAALLLRGMDYGEVRRSSLCGQETRPWHLDSASFCVCVYWIASVKAEARPYILTFKNF